MILSDLILVKYISRPNRFTIEFKDDKNKIELAHLHDPGRLKELLIEDADVLIKYVPTYKKTGRKTRYDVVAIKNEADWVLLNSSYHNNLVQELIDEKRIETLKEFHVHTREYTYGNSRLDFLLKDDDDNEMFLEVKGCTLVVDSVAKFPDAPTERGKKHVDELTAIRKEGLLSSVLILVLQNSAKIFSPNYATDPEFSKSLELAYENDVNILATHILTNFIDGSLILSYDKLLPVKFNEK